MLGHGLPVLHAVPQLNNESDVIDVSAGQKRQAPDCLRCKNYFITYDPRQPRGCRAYGFKSRDLPSHVVLSSSGAPCHFFLPR